MMDLKAVRRGRARALACGEAVKDFRLQAGPGGSGPVAASHMYLYDMIDDWFGITASDVVRALMSFGDDDVVIHVNSPGGMVTEGIAIYNTIKAHPAHVEVRIEGMAASAASFVALAGDEVLIAPSAMVMIHDAWDFTIGDEAEHLRAADVLGKASQNLANIYATEAGGTADAWREVMRGEQWYVGQEAVDAGLADGLLQVGDLPAEDTAAAAARWGSVPAREPAPAARKQPAKAGVGGEPVVDFARFRDAMKGLWA